MKNCSNCARFKALGRDEGKPYGTCSLKSMNGAMVGYPLTCDKWKRRDGDFKGVKKK